MNRWLEFLKEEGISSEIIDRVIEEEYTTEESELIEKLLIKKGYDKENATYEQRGKMYRFLAGRGFSSESIGRVLG